MDLDLTQQDHVMAYRIYTEELLKDLPPCNQMEASSHLQTLCLTSAALVQKQSHRKALRSSGSRHYDGWSATAMALKAHLVALITIQGHLHGCRGHLL